LVASGSACKRSIAEPARGSDALQGLQVLEDTDMRGVCDVMMYPKADSRESLRLPEQAATRRW
jgi:hypothetical protein